MLKRAYAYQDHDKWYLSLSYTYEDDKGKHEVIFPKVNLPVTQFDLPTINVTTEDYDPYLRHPIPITKLSKMETLIFLRHRLKILGTGRSLKVTSAMIFLLHRKFIR